MNSDNLPFYRNVGVKNLMEIAQRGGLQNFIDVKYAFEYIKHAGSIIELGAGYGRCIEYLMLCGYKGDLFAVEFVPEFVAHLKEHFGKRVQVIDGDIKSHSFQLNRKVDGALWLWSGFSDFSKEEQRQCLEKIYSLLNDHGRLVIDIPKIENKLSVGALIHNTSASVSLEKNETLLEGKDVVWETPYGVFRGYIQSKESMEQLSALTGFRKISSFEYKTETDIERVMFILEK